MFAVGSRGRLRTVASQHFTGPDADPWAAHFSPNGKLLALANLGGRPNQQFGGTISMFSVGPRGALTHVAGSPFVIGGKNGDAQNVAFSPDGRFLAVGDSYEGRVLLYAVDAGGVLSSSPMAYGRHGTQPRRN